MLNHRRVASPERPEHWELLALTGGNLGFQRTEKRDHFVPRLDSFGDGSGFVFAGRRSRGAELSADGTDHSIDSFVSSIQGAADSTTDVGFSTTGAVPLSHDSGLGVSTPTRVSIISLKALNA